MSGQQPNLLNPLAAVHQLDVPRSSQMSPAGTMRSSMRSISSAGSKSNKPRPSGLTPAFHAPITNFGNMHTPTAPTSYAPSFYPFPLGRHMWSSRCL